ncbi:MAG TPA: tail fiber domain-containing protein [Thermoleophilaceae bacterium]
MGPQGPAGATGRLGYGGAVSSRSQKRDIHPLRFSTERFMRLQPVRFRYRHGDSRIRYGLIAEDVAKLFPRMTVFDDAHKPVALRMDQLPTMLLAQVQRQQRQIAMLERRIAQLETR